MNTTAYKKVYETVHIQKRTPQDWPRIEKILEYIKKVSNESSDKCLELGAATGLITKELIEMNLDVSANDISEHNCRKLKKLGIPIYKFDVQERFPIGSNKFDLVVAGEIIEHLYDVDHFIGEIRRIIRPGGHVIITTPNAFSMDRRILTLLGSDIYENFKGTRAEHIRFFSKKAFVRWLESRGFRVLESCTTPLILPLLSRIKIFKTGPGNLGMHIVVLAKVNK